MEQYKQKRLRNQGMVHYTKCHVTEKTQKRICDCGTVLEFFTDKEINKKKLVRANFCKFRMCPMCTWRQSKKDALKISVMMKYVEQELDKDFVFLTLTAPNVKGNQLGEEITRYNNAYKELMRSQDVVRMCKGFVRKLEVTYNAERNDYHPHFHCILAVTPSYFKSRIYVKRNQWLGLWRDVMGDQSITQVDVRRMDKSTEKDVAEIAKYTAKDTDYTRNQAVFDAFYVALRRRQLLTYGGIFAEASRKFKAEALNHYLEQDMTEYVYRVLMCWGKGEYIERGRWELDAAEIEKYKKKDTKKIEDL